MYRLLAFALVLSSVALPAEAGKKGSYEKYVPRDQREPEDDASAAKGEMPLPSREALDKSELPGFAKCALNCSRPMQECTTRCKGNQSCAAGCQKSYVTCAQGCGGPIGSNPRGNGKAGAGGDDGESGCTSGCMAEMTGCTEACGEKPGCKTKCYERMSSCASSCN